MSAGTAVLGWDSPTPNLPPIPERARWQRWAGHGLGLALLLSLSTHLGLAWWMRDFAPQQVPEQADQWLEIQLQVSPTPPPLAQVEPSAQERPAAEVLDPPPPAASPTPAQIESESPPTKPPPAESHQPPAAPNAVPTTPELVTSTPATDSPDTWRWRDQLLRQGNQLTSAKPSPPGTAANDGTLPGNWTEALLPDQSSWFDQYAAPEVLKQETWTETDGTVRMEVTLPNGQRMCGRAQPADPLQPLSVSVPLWTTCGHVRGQQAERSANPLRRPPPQAHPQPPEKSS